MSAGPGGAAVEVTYSLQREDLVAISMEMARKSYRPPPRRRSEFVGVVGLLVIILAVLLATGEPSEALRSWPVWFLAGVALLLLLRGRIWLGLCRTLAKRSARTLDGCGLPTRLRATGAGVEVSNQGSESTVAWADVTSIERLGDYLLLQIAPGRFYAVPGRAFDAASRFDAFEAALRRLKEAATHDGGAGSGPAEDEGKTQRDG